MSVLEQLIKGPQFSRRFLGNGSSHADSPERLTHHILNKLVPDRKMRNLSFRLWDNSQWPDAQMRAATLVLNRPGSLREMLLEGSETAMGEAYVKQAFDVEGDIEAAFEWADQLMEKTNGWTRKLEIAHLLRQLPEVKSAGESSSHRARFNGSRHSPERDRQAISFHYNVSNDFYALWLDRQMVYSCAYFRQSAEDLETAQQNKFDHICRKLGLRAGDRLLDIGCGWGGLILHAARHYGVRAEGITLSEHQLAFARKRIEEEGMETRVSVELRDYRDLSEDDAYDAIASVGMVEHVGREKLATYFKNVRRLLKPGGLFLNHGIGLGPVIMPGETGSFIHSHVFPDSELVRIGEMIDFAEGEGWGVRDVENLREHYALTLRHWVRRLESRHEEALRFVDEGTYRIWRLYMAGCAHNFQTGRLCIYQTLLAKLSEEGASRAPTTRAAWYV